MNEVVLAGSIADALFVPLPVKLVSNSHLTPTSPNSSLLEISFTMTSALLLVAPYLNPTLISNSNEYPSFVPTFKVLRQLFLSTRNQILITFSLTSIIGFVILVIVESTTSFTDTLINAVGLVTICRRTPSQTCMHSCRVHATIVID